MLSDELAIAEKEEAELIAQEKEMEEETARIQLEVMELKRQYEEARNKLWQKSHEVNQPRQLIKSGLYKAQKKKYEIEQQLRVEEEAAKLQEDLDVKRTQLDVQSADAIWRRGNKFGDKALKHQIDGAYLLASAGSAILADSMGVGKTLTSIATLDLIGAKRILIICPGEVMSGFCSELEKWSERPPIIIGRQPKKQIRETLNFLKKFDAEEYVIIINYEAWSRDRDLLSQLEGMLFDTVICDEAHKIKETDTAAYKGVEQIALSYNQCPVCKKQARPIKACGHTGVMNRSVKHVYMLTGTPILNRPQEMYPLLHIINPRDFDNKNAFMRQYCAMDPDTGKWGFRPGGMAALAERLKGMYLRRTRETAGIKLPAQHLITHEVELDPTDHADQIELLYTLSQHAQIEIEKGRAVGVMSKLALITRQRQAATWAGGMELKVPVLDEFGYPVVEFDFDKEEYVEVYETFRIPRKYWKSAKMDAAYDLLEELVQDGQRVVVFSQFKQALYELQRRCVEGGGINSVEYHGDTPSDVRDLVKKNFDRSNHEAAKWDAVLCHFKTGGVGLNFTAATHTIILDEEWNPGMNDQAYGRTNRIGQTEENSVHIFQTVATVDEWMSELNMEKAGLVNGFNQAASDVEEKLRIIIERQAQDAPKKLSGDIDGNVIDPLKMLEK